MPTQQQAPMPDEVRYMLAKQLPSITYEMTISSNYGLIVIDDADTITEIKAVIERRAPSWN